MLNQRMKSFPAAFVRGGTSSGLIINRSSLPDDETKWQPILASAMGSPDSYGRQLNGIGQGISSTSKICIISKPEREDADIDYAFVQVGIANGDLDMAGNCGNMSSAVGPVAWDGQLFETKDKSDGEGQVTVRMFNTNTNKIIHSTFHLNDQRRYEAVGDYSIDGVSGIGSRITLSFLDPAGSKTGKALPTGNAIDTLTLKDGSTVEASLVDVANPGIFIHARDIGVPDDIAPEILSANTEVVARLERIRQAGAGLMGLDPNVQSIPKIVFVSSPTKLAQETGINIVCRALSMQQAHKSVPLTLALNLGAACRIPGTLPAMAAVGVEGKESVTIDHASGTLEVGAVMSGAGKIESALLHRTARVLMRGDVFYTVDEAEDK